MNEQNLHVSDDTPNVRLPTDGHAIEAVAIGVDWSPHLESEALTAARSAHDVVKLLLPEVKTVQAMALKVDAATKAVELGIAGDLVDFIHLGEDGRPDFTVSLRPDFFSCSSPIYSGWKRTKPLLLTRLIPFVEAARSSQAEMQAVGLQYTDVFRWAKTAGDLLPSVIRRDTTFLPEDVFSRPSLWHAHQGWFTSGHRGLRVLNLVNIDLAEEGDDFLLRLSGRHKLLSVDFNGSPIKMVTDDALDGLDGLHAINKEVLQRLLTPAMLSRIGMKTLEQI